MLTRPQSWTDFFYQPELFLSAIAAGGLWLIGLGHRVKTLETRSDSQEQTLRDINAKLDRLVEKLIPAE
jgi:hypothetical protein